MIVHIVMLKFKDENKDENILNIANGLKALIDLIPVLKFMEVGINFDESARAFDLSLYSKFLSKEDLEIYAVHPEHLKVVELIKATTLESKVVDYIL
ncbi:MAG: hypothetical protein ACJAWW_002758 [Sulfurimonas sp.]|jgi:hypothetical protein